MRQAAALLLALCAACSFTHGDVSGSRDGGMGSGDGGLAVHQQMEIVSGGGRLHAGTKTIDVEIGHGVLVRKSTAGTKTITGSPAVRP
jgi:hypothetical protein